MKTQTIKTKNYEVLKPLELETLKKPAPDVLKDYNKHYKHLESIKDLKKALFYCEEADIFNGICYYYLREYNTFIVDITNIIKKDFWYNLPSNAKTIEELRKSIKFRILCLEIIVKEESANRIKNKINSLIEEYKSENNS